MAAYLSKQAAANHRQIAATLRATLTIAPVSLFSPIPTSLFMQALEIAPVSFKERRQITAG